MIGATQFAKLRGDFMSIRTRLALVVGALAIGLFVTITISTAYSILSREIAGNYTDTNPATGILDIGKVSPGLLKRVRGMDGVAEADTLDIFETRVRYQNGGWDRALLFVSEAPLQQNLARLPLKNGDGTGLLLERRALKMTGLNLGDTIGFEIPGAGLQQVVISGSVFDPALAPAEQEKTVWAYLSRADFVALGGAALAEQIRVQIKGDPLDQILADKTLAGIANILREDGVNVHLVQVPNAGRHPHASQMIGVLLMFLAFGIAAFILSTLLVSVTIEGLMAQQLRQIAIMKTIGGQRGQITRIYAIGVLTLGIAALLLAIYPGIAAGNTLAKVVGELLNFDIRDNSVAPYIVVFWIISALALPLLAALRPIRRATSATVTSIIADKSMSRAPLPNWLSVVTEKLSGGNALVTMSMRGLFRRRGRTMMIVFLLALAGSVFLSARITATSYERSIEIAAQQRLHDVEITLTQAVSRDLLTPLLFDEKISTTRLSYQLEAALGRKDGLTLVRTYPDGGHGAVTLITAEDSTAFQHLTLLAGEIPTDMSNGLVLNQGAHRILGSPKPGENVLVSLDGNMLSLPLLAVVQQFLTPANGYTSATVLGELSGKVNNIRLTLSDPDIADETVTNLDGKLQKIGTGIVRALTEKQMAEAVAGHVNIMIVILLALGVLMAMVGFFGLAAAQGVAVSERVREFGILRAIGARKSQILTGIIVEGAFIGLVSLPLTFILAVPLSLAITVAVGLMTFGLPLPFTFDWMAAGLWIVVALLGALIASIPPALRAGQLTVRDTLTQS